MGSKAMFSVSEAAQVVALKEIASTTDLRALIARYNELKSGGFDAEYALAKTFSERKPNYYERITRSKPDVNYRNRYGNVVTLDDTRVRLVNVAPDESDYINASLVKHLDGPHTIVAQAPLRHTAEHFWQMCWEQDVPMIIMLTNFDEPHGGLGEMREKSYRYFALNESESITFGDYRVMCVSKVSVVTGWDERRLALLHVPTNSRKELVHIHCTDWPDFGRLDGHQLQGLNRGLELVQSTRANTRGPALVHCSAGIGRSGTFVALENLLAQAKANNWSEVDPVKVVASLRNQRPGMVQTASQYEMIYDVLVSLLQQHAQ